MKVTTMDTVNFKWEASQGENSTKYLYDNIDIELNKIAYKYLNKTYAEDVYVLGSRTKF